MFDILYVINMPSSSPAPSIPSPPAEKSQTARRHEKTANVTLGPYTAPSSLRAHNKKPPAAPAAELPPHLFCVTLTPPCHVPPPIKKARSKTRDSLDIFRRKHNKEHYNGCREEKKKNVTIWTSKQEDEEEEAVTAMWGNWSYTMSPVSLLTHLANEFMDKDKCPSPSPSRNPNSTRHIQSRQDDYARVQGRGRRRQRNRSASTSVLASAATSSQRNRSGSDDNGNTSDWPLRLNTSSESAQGRRWRQATGLGTDGPGMARVKEKEKEMQVGKVGRISSSSSGGNESITHEYLKVFENDQGDDQGDEGPERYGAGYEGKRIIPDLEAESPEEWEWDRLLEEMEK